MKQHISILLIFLSLSIMTCLASDRKKYNFNSEWLLQVGDNQNAYLSNFDDSSWTKITLPRAFNEDEAFRLPIDQHTDTVMWYRKRFRIPQQSKKQKVFIEFEGIRQGGHFYINDHYLGLHENGVMAFGFDLTPYIVDGENVIAIRIDNDWRYKEESTESVYQWNDRNFNANYGGIPKNVFLHITNPTYQTLPLYSNLNTTGVYIYATDIDVANGKATINAESEVKNETSRVQNLKYQVELFDRDGESVKQFDGECISLNPGETAKITASANIGNLNFWSWGYGYLYDVKTRLLDQNNNVIDEVNTRTGFRKTKFGEGKVWLNDRVIQLKGYAQRTSNEWPAVGLSVPAWLSDYSNNLIVKSNGNLVRWMHVTPWKQDVESCDRVGLIQAMPAGDSERDADGRRWEHRLELMRDAIIYNRNNPSILLYECGNRAISEEHMAEMMEIRNLYDPYGGRAIGSREMLDSEIAEWGGEMLYINKSAKHPMWATEYCRNEGLRKYWDEYSYPFHKEGDGPLYRDKPATEYNHNQDQFAIELVRRWYDYWRNRPGTGRRVSSGGTNIIFSDTNTHFRGEENYRRSGVTDPMRIEKDGFFAHQVMWNGWVDTEAPQTYIIGHWNYPENTTKPVYVVSNGDHVELLLNDKPVGEAKRDYNFLYTFDDVTFEPGKLEAISYDKNGNELSRYEINSVGEATDLKLTLIQSPAGFHADGADLVLVQVEVVDKDGNRCPLDNRLIRFSLTGEAEWRGGIAQGTDNYILNQDLPVECGVNRVLIRSTTKAGDILLTAKAEGLPDNSLNWSSIPVEVSNGLNQYLPNELLAGYLDKGATPSTPSYYDTKKEVLIVSVNAGSNSDKVKNSFDDNEMSEWSNDGNLGNAWITYNLEREATINEICMKLTDWRSTSYPLEIFANNELIWSGETDKSLGYVHLSVKPVKTDKITISLKGSTSDSDAFGQIVEMEPDNQFEIDKSEGNRNVLSIVEIEFLEKVNRR